MTATTSSSTTTFTTFGFLFFMFYLVKSAPATFVKRHYNLTQITQNNTQQKVAIANSTTDTLKKT